MLVVLKHGANEKTLGAGEFVLGRSNGCDFVVEDPLVSRRHARIVVTPEATWVDDLESANGVYVSGERITGRCRLDAAEVIRLGSAAVRIRRLPNVQAPGRDDNAGPPIRSGAHARPVIAAPAAESHAEPRADDDHDDADAVETDETRRASRFELLTAFADRAFAAGRVADAERFLSGQLKTQLNAARAGQTVAVATVDWCVQQALRLARETTHGTWVDYAVESFLVVRRVMPAAIVDELYAVIRIASPIDIAMLRRYVAMLAELESTMAPTERFLARRIAGLERMARAG